MPRAPKCDCGKCKTCTHRAYMKEWRHENPPVIKPKIKWETPWETSARLMGEELSRYTCPLAGVVADAEALIGHSRGLRMAAGAAMLDMVDADTDYVQ